MAYGTPIRPVHLAGMILMIGGMHLMHTDQPIGPQVQRGGDPLAVDADDIVLIRAAKTAVQPFEHARRCTARAGEKPVGGIGQGGVGDDL